LRVSVFLVEGNCLLCDLGRRV